CCVGTRCGSCWCPCWRSASSSVESRSEEPSWAGLPRKAGVPGSVLRAQFQQVAAVAVLQEPDGAVGALLDRPDAGSHRPVLGLGGVLALEVHALQGLAGEGPEEGVALPGREEVTVVDQQ